MGKSAGVERIEVDWVDSCSAYGWMGEAEALEARTTRCSTIGFVVREDDEEIAIAQNRTLDGRADPWGEVIAIAKSAILKYSIVDVKEAPCQRSTKQSVTSVLIKAARLRAASKKQRGSITAKGSRAKRR
jgi:hypothetical protein